MNLLQDFDLIPNTRLVHLSECRSAACEAVVIDEAFQALDVALGIRHRVPE